MSRTSSACDPGSKAEFGGSATGGIAGSPADPPVRVRLRQLLMDTSVARQSPTSKVWLSECKGKPFLHPSHRRSMVATCGYLHSPGILEWEWCVISKRLRHPAHFRSVVGKCPSIMDSPPKEVLPICLSRHTSLPPSNGSEY
eukprot:1226851-Amphidinium_carterae.1